MRAPTLLVLGNPAARHLALLDHLPTETHILAGETEQAFSAGVDEGQVVLMAGSYREVLQALWPRLKRLEWVHSMWAGLEGVLFPELVESAVPLTNSRGVFARSLGEFAIAGMLHFAKRIGRMKSQQSRALWEPFEVEELHGRVLGIVGYGSIGRAAAERARAFGMRIHVLRRHADRAAEDALVERVYGIAELTELMAASDYVLAAAPLTAETRGLIGTQAIRGAVLDVFDREPLEPEHPFWSMDNVLLSPHTADRTATWLDEAMELFLENYRRFAAGQALLNVADKRLGY